MLATPTSDRVADAMCRLGADGFIAYPTETVWGLGACADRPRAVERLMAWKGRAPDAPIAVLVADAEAGVELGCRFDVHARRLVEAYWPGPLMVVVPCSGQFALGVARSDGALGLRCSPHPLAHALAVATRAAGLGPLTSTSLNRSGAAATFDAAIEMTHDADPGDLASPLTVGERELDAGGSQPSSVVDCTGVLPEVLRVGAIDREALEERWSS